MRQFCRLYVEPAPDDTTLIRWANTVGPETIEALNDRAVELARTLKVTRGRKLRVDSTVVETNVHHPTDSRLLGDGVRVVSRLLRKANTIYLYEDARDGGIWVLRVVLLVQSRAKVLLALPSARKRLVVCT